MHPLWFEIVQTFFKIQIERRRKTRVNVYTFYKPCKPNINLPKTLVLLCDKKVTI